MREVHLDIIIELITGFTTSIPRPIFTDVTSAPNVTEIAFAHSDNTMDVKGFSPIDSNKGATNIAGTPNPARPSKKAYQKIQPKSRTTVSRELDDNALLRNAFHCLKSSSIKQNR